MAAIVKLLHWEAGATRFTCLKPRQLPALYKIPEMSCQEIRIYKLTRNLFPQQKSISKWDLGKIEFHVDFVLLLKEWALQTIPTQIVFIHSFSFLFVFSFQSKSDKNWSVKMNLNLDMFSMPNYGFNWFQILLSSNYNLHPHSQYARMRTCVSEPLSSHPSSQQFRLILSLISANPSQSCTSGL